MQQFKGTTNPAPQAQHHADVRPLVFRRLSGQLQMCRSWSVCHTHRRQQAHHSATPEPVPSATSPLADQATHPTSFVLSTVPKETSLRVCRSWQLCPA